MLLSAIITSSLSTDTRLFTATDSPVNADSSTFRFSPSTTLASAAIRSPARNTSISPGTISFDAILSSLPALTTEAAGAAISFNALIAFSDLNSKKKPSTTQRITAPNITAASIIFPNTADIAVANRSITIRALNCVMRIFSMEILLPAVISFLPYLCCLFSTSSGDSPSSVVQSLWKTSSGLIKCHCSSLSSTTPSIFLT